MNADVGTVKKKVAVVCALIASLVMSPACTHAQEQKTPQYPEPDFIQLPQDLVEAIIELGVKDPFVLYAVDIDGTLVGLLPPDVEVEELEYPLDGVRNIEGVTVFRYQASDAVGVCRWPPKNGDKPCSGLVK